MLWTGRGWEEEAQPAKEPHAEKRRRCRQLHKRLRIHRAVGQQALPCTHRQALAHILVAVVVLVRALGESEAWRYIWCGISVQL